MLMRPLVRRRFAAFTILESLVMIGLMMVLALMTWAIYLKETDPDRKGPGVWDKMETPFTPAFRDVGLPGMPVAEPRSNDPIPSAESGAKAE